MVQEHLMSRAVSLTSSTATLDVLLSVVIHSLAEHYIVHYQQSTDNQQHQHFNFHILTNIIYLLHSYTVIYVK